MRQYAGITLVTIGVASAMHLDWHLARPAHHHLSLGWSQHWLSAIPVFAAAAFYVVRAWPGRLVWASGVIIGMAAFLAQVVEPLEEIVVDGASFEWAFGTERLAAFALFTSVGIALHVAALALLRRPGSDRIRAAR